MQTYHNEKVSELLKEVKASNGLTSEEAKSRIIKYGLNEFDKQKKKSIILMFLAQFKDIMLLVLLGASFISLAIQEYGDALIIFFVIFLNAFLSVIQEYKAVKALESLKKLSNPHVLVKRDNIISKIPSAQLTIGDLVYFETGDIISADIQLTEAINLTADESSLTGESLPQEKNTISFINTSSPLYHKNMVFSGTNITAGRGQGVVVAIGMDTQIGKIAKHLNDSKEELTPLQARLANMAKILTFGVVIIMLVIMAIGLMQGREFLEMLMISVSLGVAAIPEGLPTVVTIVLALGVMKMAKKNVIVKKLSSVETLGCTEYICSDKTGTLTQNKMEVQEIYLNGNIYNKDNVINNVEYNNKLFYIASLCNSLIISKDNTCQGDPTEKAIYEYAIKNGFDKEQLQLHHRFINEIPFDSKRKLMSVTYYDGYYNCYVKGAPDILIRKCNRKLKNGVVTPLTEFDEIEITRQIKQMGDKSLRVLGFAYKGDMTAKPQDNEEHNLIFVGLMGMIDPPRPSVFESIEKCKKAGIKLIMITGDNKDTAYAIATELKIIDNVSQLMTGSELDQMDDKELAKNITKYKVFCRVSPNHKVRIVKCLQAKKKIVAMTGDGVNDAPSLKIANIGVGMGIAGTEVAKEASDMILQDDNFSTIVVAIEEGRKIYSNITKAIIYLLSSNLGEVVTLFIATLLNQSILLPIHILWMNLVTDSLPALALGLEKNDANTMQEKPRSANQSFFAGNNGFSVIYQGVIQGLLTLFSFFIGLRYFNLRIAETMAFTTIVFIQLFHAINMRSLGKSIFKIGHNLYLYFAIIMAAASHLLIIYVPFLSQLFKVDKINGIQWSIAILLAFMIIPVVEVVKLLNSVKNKQKRKKNLQKKKNV